MEIRNVKVGESFTVGAGTVRFLAGAKRQGETGAFLASDSGLIALASGHYRIVCGQRIKVLRLSDRKARIGILAPHESVRVMEDAHDIDRRKSDWHRKMRLPMPKALAVACCLFLFATLAFAQRIVPGDSLGSVVFEVAEPVDNTPEETLREVRAHVVKVTAPLYEGGNASGSGIYLGDKLVLTAAHVVRGSRQDAIECSFPEPSKPSRSPFVDVIRGKVLASDASWDQAVVELERLPKHNPPGSPLANDNPKRGDKVSFAGYPRGGVLKMTRGVVKHYAFSTTAQHRNSDWFVADAGVIGGYSGGAAYNDSGELFGNLWGSDGTTTIAVCLGRTKRFLLPWNARLEAWRLSLASGKASPMACCPLCGVCGGHRQGCPAAGSGGVPPRYIEPGDGVPVEGGGVPSAPPGGSLTPVPTPSGPSTSELIATLDKFHADINARLDKVKGCECEDKPASPPSSVAYELTESDLTKITGNLLVAMQGDPAFRGPPGEKGERGDKGDSGKAAPATLSDEQISAIAAKLPPVMLEIHNEGKVSRAIAPLGKPIAIGRKDRKVK